MSQHAALLSCVPSSDSDIFPELFDWFFAHPSFQRWSQERVKWQLHCVGSPGSGKTTLAALAARHLEIYFRPQAVVLSIFVQKNASVSEPELLEDFLAVVYQKLGEREECNSENEEYRKYLSARFEKEGGSRIQLRLSLLRKALHTRLRQSKDEARVFVIVDGIDCCSSSLRLLLDAEFVELQGRGCQVMVTSRIATYEFWEVKCDHPDHGQANEIHSVDLDKITGRGSPQSETNTADGTDSSKVDFSSEDGAGDSEERIEEDDEYEQEEDRDEDDDEDYIDYSIRERLDIYLTCAACDKVLCFDCHSAGRVCTSKNCMSNEALFEDYDHVNISVDTTEDAMKKYIAWDLEREHGDLGLGSTARRPPSSVLGASLRNYPDRARTIAARIEDHADGHIGLAKAGLDTVHDASSAEDLVQLRYQLPNNVVTLYEAALAALEAQEPHRRDLGLKVLAAARHDPDGVDIPFMQQILEHSVPTILRSGEEIVEAARGFLSVMRYKNPQRVIVFHETFWDFISDRYSESLHEAGRDLKQHNPVRRTFSYQKAPAAARSELRWEPMTLSEEPAEITPARMKRTVTSLQTISEAPPSRAYILRKGTRMWR